MICILAFGCGIERIEFQIIEISYYPDNERNAKLAEDLFHYDPRYLAHKIPSLDEETSKGLQLGYSGGSPDGKSSYKIKYDLNNPAISSNIDDLKAQFDSYIPKLAALHASKEPIFAELRPIGSSWAQSFLSGDLYHLLEESSEILKEAATVEQLSELRDELLDNYGPITELTFVRAQFYEQFAELPQSVSLYYEAQADEDIWLLVSFSQYETENQWRANGFTWTINEN